MSDSSAGAEPADAPTRYPVVHTVEHFTGHVIAVRTDTVALPGGEEVERDVVAHPGAVAVIALDDDGRVLLVHQYRHPAGQLLWEPPAGLLDEEGEAASATAARELYEEAGYRAGRLDVLVDAFTSPGMTDEAVRIYLARDLRPVGADERYAGEHEERDMPTAWFDLDDAVGAVLAGRVHNPLAVMGLLAVDHARRDGFAGLRPVDAPWPVGKVPPA